MKNCLIAGIPIRTYFQNHKEIVGIYKRYLNYLESNGFLVIFLTINNATYLISKLDCLILIGGGDINPLLYNKIDKKINFDDQLDALEYKCIEYMTKNNKPILGICRGLQILNVYFGGSLKEIPANHCGPHLIFKGLESKTTNSFHHQCIDQLAKNFHLVSQSKDMVIEEIEDNKRMIYAVQYHPEINYFKSYFK